MAYPVHENVLGLRRLSKVVHAFSCKLWCKWHTNLGIWSHYLNSLTRRRSCIAQHLSQVDAFMRSTTLILVKNGSSSLFFDNWSGQGEVVDIFLLEVMTALRSISLSEAYVDGQWNSGFLTDFLEPHVIHFIVSFRFSLSTEPDVVIWQPFPTGSFTLSLAYQELHLAGPNHSSIFKHIWSSAMPLRLSIFGWHLLNGLLPFPEIFRQFSFHLPFNCFVPHCLAEDSIQHCFLHCSFARIVWQFFAQQLQIQFGLDADVFSIFQVRWSCNERGRIGAVWLLIFLY